MASPNPPAQHFLEKSTDTYPATGFGGYNWSGNVNEINAEWRIPTISPTSPVGIAATWIGAQNLRGKGFIQIGVNEVVVKEGQDEYIGFWSDTAVGFKPQNIGVFFPGELVFASMKRDAHGWRISLAVKDFTLTRNISYGIGDHFTTGEWIQENPAPGNVASQDSPYPVMADVSFRDLKVDGKKPHLGLNDGLVLITSTGEIRVPTALRDDAFTFTPPRGVQLQYLEDARVLDAGTSAFQAEFANWQTTSARIRTIDVKTFIAALKMNITTFESQTWPALTRAPMSKLVEVTKREIADLQDWLRSGFQINGSGFRKYESTLSRHERYADEVRGSLRLPPLSK